MKYKKQIIAAGLISLPIGLPVIGLIGFTLLGAVFWLYAFITGGNTEGVFGGISYLVLPFTLPFVILFILSFGYLTPLFILASLKHPITKYLGLFTYLPLFLTIYFILVNLLDPIINGYFEWGSFLSTQLFINLPGFFILGGASILFIKFTNDKVKEFWNESEKLG